MAQNPTEIKSGATVELADKETSFFDPETKLKVVREDSVKLGKNIGAKTNTAIMSGRLVVVGASKETAASAKTVESDLPEDLPGRDAFVAAKMDFEAVKTFDFAKDKVSGVGEATIKAVQEYLKK